MRSECGPETRSNWSSVPMASFSALDESIEPGWHRCGPSYRQDASHLISNRFAARPMTQRFGIDTSVLVRLVTGDPRQEFARCVTALSALVEEERAEIFVSNQVVGEAYIAVQHHYGISKTEARAGLVDVLQSGLVTPLNGGSVLAALEASGGAGLFDRLISDDYSRASLLTLTLDKRMASLPHVRRL